MRLDTFYALLGSQCQELLAELGGEPVTPDNHLRMASSLRTRVRGELANAILETLLLRQRAATKFSRASEMYFTDEALQQASAEVISRYRARRFAKAGFSNVADLGCGIGGDALALSSVAQVVGIDWDPLRLAMARENVRVYGNGPYFHPLQADLHELTPLAVEALFADPGRRDEYGHRIYSVHNYRPPLDTIDAWRGMAPHQALKVSPGINYAELPEEAEAEFISVGGAVRECVLWYGDLRSGPARRATLLPEAVTMIDESVEPVAVTEPRAFLYEPDGAVIRAHLVEQLAIMLEATKIDDDIAYLTADEPKPTPFANCYAVEDVLPFQLKRLRRYLRERNVGRLTIKKRGSPLDPDQLRKQLRLSGVEERVIFLTRVKGAATVLVSRFHS